MAAGEWLADPFEEHRGHLRTVAYRMLGSASEAEDAVQETWIRLGRTDVGDIASLRRWLTTVVARVCLDMLRARTSRREDPLDVRLPDPIITRGEWEPESEAMLADSLGLALLIVLDTLAPAERLAFVLHDVFGMTFDEIAPIVDRSPVAARQLASRARRRVQSKAPSSDRDLRRQRRVVDAFLAAVREGNFEHLVALLDPDIVLRADGGAPASASRVVRGAKAVAGQAAAFSKSGLSNQIVLVNGNVGLLARRPDGRLFAVIGFTIAGGRIAEMNILADPDRLSRLDLSAIERCAALLSVGKDGEGTLCERRKDMSTLRRRPVPRKDSSRNPNSASTMIDQRIRELGDWRGSVLKRMRELIHEADPEVVEEWKWRKASSPGTPVWSHDGGICTGESYQQVVKLTFFHGASLKDPAHLFNSSLEGNTRRAIDIHKDDAIEEAAFKELIRAAVAFNVAKRKK